MRRVLVFLACFTGLCLLGVAASAKGNAYITQGSRSSPGVAAQAAASYSAPTRGTARASSASEVSHAPSTRVLVPLVAQTLCGHDPRLPGGQTCVLDPPPRPTVADTRPPRQPPSPEEVARRLTDRAIRIAPRPQLRLAPGRRGLTGLPSYFWLARRPRPIQAAAGAGGVTVTAQARPVQYVWTYGDGTNEVTRRPGRRWTRARAGSIRHTYETKGRYDLTVEVIWHARWRIGAGGWRSLGFFSNSDTRGYRVRSIVPVLVRVR